MALTPKPSTLPSGATRSRRRSHRGGVVSHHHGIGRLRKEALARELGPGGSEAHGALKRAWDPDGIMNPGSAFEPDARAGVASRRSPADDAPIVIDALSGLVRLRGNVRLDDAERALGERGLTLGLDPTPSTDVNAWIATGMPGLPDPWLDPVEQRLAGLDAVLASGARLTQRPAPRRATGPDLAALLVGAGEPRRARRTSVAASETPKRPTRTSARLRRRTKPRAHRRRNTRLRRDRQRVLAGRRRRPPPDKTCESSEDQITIGASGNAPHKQNRRDRRWLLHARKGRSGLQVD